MTDLRGLMKLLNDSGGKVYIDSMDNSMPDQTSSETALRIKKEIKFCKKFILFATKEAIESYWCNWELGFGDTHKYIENIAIFPMKDAGVADSKYIGNEYLQIYPAIEFRNGTTKYKSSGEVITKGYYVCKPKDDSDIRIITPLKKWLNS
jgi:hypothetical protein